MRVRILARGLDLTWGKVRLLFQLDWFVLWVFPEIRVVGIGSSGGGLLGSFGGPRLRFQPVDAVSGQVLQQALSPPKGPTQWVLDVHYNQTR